MTITLINLYIILIYLTNVVFLLISTFLTMPSYHLICFFLHNTQYLSWKHLICDFFKLLSLPYFIACVTFNE